MAKAKIVKPKNQAYHGKLPPNPYTQNSKYYDKVGSRVRGVKKARRVKHSGSAIPVETFFKRVKLALMLAPLILAIIFYLTHV